MDFTKEQELAINTRGSNIIVSAGAGSGKTAVLTERILRMLKDGYDISRLLVLTFTNAAALEMKVRIKKKVVENGSLKEQEAKIDTAYITTFDAFALSMVKKYHYLLSVSKDITIADSVVMKLKKEEILDDIFNELYHKEDNEFLYLLTKFTFKDDRSIKSSILKIATSLEKMPDNERFLEQYLNDFYSNARINGYIKVYVKECNERLRDFKLSADEMYTLVPDSSFGQFLYEFIDYISDNHTYEELVAYLTTLSIPAAPKGEKEVQELKKKFSEELKKYISSFLKFENTEKIKESLIETKQYVKVIIDILVLFFNRINFYKHSQNVFEFNDISMLLLNLFDKNDEVLEEVASSFDYILLDEYQDTSDIQEKFIKLIGRNNVYMVGDIKQSIYRFRNANPYIFKEKYDNYKVNNGGIKIDLIQNYRSRKEVLNNINLLFKHLMTDECGDADYINEHQMNFGNTDYEKFKMDNFTYDQEYLTYEPDQEKIYSNDEIEVFVIAEKIKELMNSNKLVYDKDTRKLRPIRYNDIAVIIPRKKNVDLIQKIFTSEGVPLNIAIDEKITDSPIIRLISSVVNLVNAVDSKDYQRYSFYFVSVARSFLFKQSDNYILKESLNYYKDNEIYDIAKRVKIYSFNHSVIKTFEYLLQEFNVYSSLVKIGDVNKHLLVLNYLSDMVSNLTEYKYDFDQVAKHFEIIVDEEIEINYSNKTNANGVVLINIHKSKGLEYPICFFCDLTAGFNRQDIKESFLFDKDFGLITPYFSQSKEDTILKTLYKHKYIKEDISEKIRLFYVALTRAREKMYFVIPKIDNLKKVASPFLFNSYANFISYYYDEAISKYVKNLSYDDYINKDYLDFTVDSIGDKITKTTPIKYVDYEFNKTTINKNHISKKVEELITKDQAITLKIGTRLHEVLQVLDFNNIDFSKLNLIKREEDMLNNVLSLECFNSINNAKVYKEFEFMYESDSNFYHGIIDLLIEHDDCFIIIDYKLSDIDKPEYEVQLNEYYKYVSQITNKKIKMYLLSLTKAKLKEVFVIQ